MLWSIALFFIIVGFAAVTRDGDVTSTTEYQIAAAIFDSADRFLISTLHIPLRRMMGLWLSVALAWYVGPMVGLEVAITLSLSRYLIGAAPQEHREMEAEAIALLKNGTEAMSFLSIMGMPPWIVCSNVEKVRWMDNLVADLWPYIAGATENSIVQAVNSALSTHSNAVFGTLSIKECKIGRAPLTIQGVSESHTHDSTTLNLHVEWVSDAVIRVTTNTLIKLELVVRNIVLHPCEVRVELADHVDRYPCFNEVRVSFTAPPTVRFDLHAVVPWNMIPGVSDAIAGFVRTVVLAPYIYPRHYAYALGKSSWVAEAEPIGKVEVDILFSRELSFFKRPPHALVKANGKTLEKLRLEGYRRGFRGIVFDVNTIFEIIAYESTADEPLAVKKVDLRTMIDDGLDDKEREEDIDTVDGKGSLHLQYAVRLALFDKNKEGLGVKVPQLSQRLRRRAAGAVSPVSESGSPVEHTPQAASAPRHYYMLVKVERCENLKNVETFGMSDPFVELSCSGAKSRTATKKNNLSPTFNETLQLELPSVQVNLTTLEVSVFDEERVGSPRPLGNVSIPLSDVFGNGNSLSGTFHLDTTGTVTLDIKIYEGTSTESRK